MRTFLPAIIPYDIPEEYRSTSYTFKMVFPDGKYLVNSSSFGTSGSTVTYYPYNQNNVLMGSLVYAPNLSNPSSTTSARGVIMLLTNQISGDVLDPGGNLDVVIVYDQYMSDQTPYASRDSSLSLTGTTPTYTFFASEQANVPLPPEPGDDPYSGGGTSETGGGGGDFGVNRFGDGIDDETITQPDYDALDQLERSVLGSNFVSIYNPTRTNVQALKNYLWSSQIGDTLKKLYNNPMDSIISLHMVPVTPTTTTGTIHIGGTDTEVEGRPVTNQYVTLSCGSLTIGEYWAAYLDYNPYTKLYLYLPFCGMHSVDTDEFMGQTLSIRYDVDVVTGDCLCSVSGSRAGGMSTILYQYAGNCSVEIPVSAANYNARISAGLGLVGSAVGIAAAAATGGMTAPLAATAVASTAANVLSGKTRVERSGALAGSAAWMGPLKPYLILVQPTQCLPDGQASFTGYPSYITAAVGDLTGYTEFAEIHLEGIAATDAEKAEIEQILRTGVIL